MKYAGKSGVFPCLTFSLRKYRDSPHGKCDKCLRVHFYLCVVSMCFHLFPLARKPGATAAVGVGATESVGCVVSGTTQIQ